MQNRYVGDVGDFGKYSLLRWLTNGRGLRKPLKLAVAWCLFPDEGHNEDGRHIAYLRREDFRVLDPHLHDVLKDIILSNNRRVVEIEKSSLLPDNTIFFRACTCSKETIRGDPDAREAYRRSWLQNCLEATSGCELVFFDPDNGIEIASVNKRHPKAGKYIFWDEFLTFAHRGQSLLIYHHLNRTKPVAEQVKILGHALRERLPAGFEVQPLIFRRGSCRVFWLAHTDDLAERFRSCIQQMMAAGWGAHFEVSEAPRSGRSTS